MLLDARALEGLHRHQGPAVGERGEVEDLDDEGFRGVKPADVDLDEAGKDPRGRKRPQGEKPSGKQPLDPKFRGVKPEDVDLD